jgi:SAM-dependent methyltransferase
MSPPLPSVLGQVRDGVVVCPVTHQHLEVEGDELVAAGGRRYRLAGGVPILHADEAAAERYLSQGGGAMAAEYAPDQPRARGLQQRFDNWLSSREIGYPPAEAAAQRVLWDLGPETVRIAVGGGPGRWDAGIVNLNIAPFPNVDLVGDAYALPYADASVDAILCWAVLEHLEFPDRAVAEIERVLKPGARALFSTPFLTPYHGYPEHFQNLTLTGQTRMLERAGLQVESSGAVEGPIFTLIDVASVALRTYLPGRAAPGVLARLLRLLMVPLRPLDRRLAARADGHVVAANVFAVARKR